MIDRGRAAKHRYIVALIMHTERDLLQKFQRIVGSGRISGPYKAKKNRRWKRYYHWRSYESRKVMSLIHPWLGATKRRTFIKLRRSI